MSLTDSRGGMAAMTVEHFFGGFAISHYAVFPLLRHFQTRLALNVTFGYFSLLCRAPGVLALLWKVRALFVGCSCLIRTTFEVVLLPFVFREAVGLRTVIALIWFRHVTFSME